MYFTIFQNIYLQQDSVRLTKETGRIKALAKLVIQRFIKMMRSIDC